MKNDIVYWDDSDTDYVNLCVNKFETGLYIYLLNINGSDVCYTLNGPMPSEGYLVNQRLKSNNMEDAKKEALKMYKNGLIKSIKTYKEYIQSWEKIVKALDEM